MAKWHDKPTDVITTVDDIRSVVRNVFWIFIGESIPVSACVYAGCICGASPICDNPIDPKHSVENTHFRLLVLPDER